MESKANRILTIFFAALCAISFAHLVIGFLSIPDYYNRTSSLTIQRYDIPGANYPTNESVKQSAAEHGLTLSQFAIEQITFHSAIVLLFLAIAGLIVAHARWNWFAWYSAFFLVFIAGFAFYDEVYVAQLVPLWVFEAGALFWPLIVLYFFLFPNGRAAPRKALWAIAPFLVFHFSVQTSGFLSLFFVNSVFSSFLDFVLPAQVIVYFAFVFILGCQIYRYRRISTREEKQQTKWFLLGFVFFIGLSLVSELLGNRNPYRAEVGLLIFAFVPLSVGLALLRYHLWDIDLIIRRTLQYSLLTFILGLVYFGMVTLLQALFAGFSRQQSPLTIVLSTLVLAILFNPLRRRLQRLIDRSFYRQRYDAARTLDAFGTAARAEVELEELTGHLASVVSETFQPESVSLWIKPQFRND